MSNDIRDFVKKFALRNLSYFVGNLMESNCRKTKTTSQDVAECMAVRLSSIHVAEDPYGPNDSVRIAFETAGKEGLFGHYGNRPMSILFSPNGSSVMAALQTQQSVLLPHGGDIGVGCTAGSIRDIPTGDAMSLDASGETNNGADGGVDATRRGTDTVSEDGSVDTSDAGPTRTDAELDVEPDVTADVALDMSEDATFTQDAISEVDASTDTMTDAELDAGAETSDDAAQVDASVQDSAADASGTQDVPEDIPADVADAVDLPNEVSDDAASADASVQDAAGDVSAETSSGICQYFCDTGTMDAKDATLPQDASPATDILNPPVGVASKMCTGPAGTELLFAPANSVAAACTNSSINAMIAGAKGCVAECGFYDNNVILSTNPNNPVKFAMDLFIPPQAPMQPYTITLALQPALLSGGGTPALPGFMGSSFVFAFNQKLYDAVGDIIWEAKDNDANGAPKGTVQIKYQPEDFFFKLPEFLDITYTDLAGSKVSYRFPCNTLVDTQGVPNPIINCTEVK